MNVVKLIRPVPVIVRLFRQMNGPTSLLRPPVTTLRLIANRGPVVFIQNASELAPVTLTVTVNGQTVWDLGLAEHRRALWVNGVRYFENDSYTLSGGILTWTDTLIIKTFFNLQLT